MMVLSLRISTRRGGTPVAAQEMGEASPAAVNVGGPPERISKKMAVPLATQEAVEVSLAVVDAGLPTEKTNERGRSLWPP